MDTWHLVDPALLPILVPVRPDFGPDTLDEIRRTA
jgi:hypothetical protein